MRELNTTSHKVRRSSFSNSLSLLPEVEESEANSPIPAILEVPKAQTDSNHKPSVIQLTSLPPQPRPRFNTLPSMSKTQLSNHPIYSRRFSSDSPGTVGHRTDLAFVGELSAPAAKWKNSSNVTYLYGKGGEGQGHCKGRRRSIGFPVSRDIQDYALADRSATTAKAENHNDGNAHHPQPVDVTMATTATTRKQKVSNHPWKPLNNPRKFSDPWISLEDKDRQKVLQDPMLRRRWSNPAFAETAKKVNLIIRLGQNMRHKRSPSDFTPDSHKGVRTLADLVVDMPKNPRFSALMSPEAQYSMMMGYEDKLYHGLVQQSPGYENVLKRNKTPVQKVEIRRKSCLRLLDDCDDDDDDEGDDDSDEESTVQQASSSTSFMTQPTEDSVATITSSNLYGCRYNQHRGSTQSLDSSISDIPERSDSRNTLRNLRRLSLSIEKKDYLNRFFDKLQGDAEDDEVLETSSPNLHRSCSLPNVTYLPFSRQLVMTHRLESAMDILDALKAKGDNPMFLSPRLKARKSVPLVDYSSWVKEWNREFHVRPGKS